MCIRDSNKGGNDGPADLDSGHGTHVTGSILGSGAASAQSNEVIRGIAPEATLVLSLIHISEPTRPY